MDWFRKTMAPSSRQKDADADVKQAKEKLKERGEANVFETLEVPVQTAKPLAPAQPGLPAQPTTPGLPLAKRKGKEKAKPSQWVSRGRVNPDDPHN